MILNNLVKEFSARVLIFNKAFSCMSFILEMIAKID